MTAQAPTETPTPTDTATPTDTPIPVPTDTPQPVAPPLDTDTPTPTPQEVAQASPNPQLLEPGDGHRFSGGSLLLKWQWSETLGPDQYFDVQIRPEGQPESVFVDWSKTTEYELSKAKWTTWKAGTYVWRVEVIRGHYEGEQKVFEGSLGLTSESRLFYWDEGGGDGGGDGGGGPGW